MIYQILGFALSFGIPLIGISYCYYRVFREVSRQNNQMRKISKPPKEGPINNKIKTDIGGFKTDVKAIKTIGIVVAMFVACWLPFFAVDLINGFCNCVENKYLITFVKIIHHTNSALNPLVYVWYNKKYREALVTAVNNFARHHGLDFVVEYLHYRAESRMTETSSGEEERKEKIVFLRS